MVIPDSMHTHEHVREKLSANAPLVTIGNYCVVSDLIIEGLPGDMFPVRPWGSGNNTKTAIWESLLIIIYS